MKWRLLLIVSLLAAMLLCSNAIAYADEGEVDNSDSTVGEEVNSNTDTAVDGAPDAVASNPDAVESAPDAVESNPDPVDCGADSSDSAASGDAVESGEDNSDLTVNVGVQGDDVELNVAVNADSADVLVVVDSEDPEVNVLTGDNSEVNMGVGQDSSIYINGQDINQPTVVHHHSDGGDGGGISWYHLLEAIRKKLVPVYSWMENRDGAISLTMDGLAKVIIETKSQDSAIDVMSADIAKNSEGIDALQNNIDSKTLSLENQLALSMQHTEDMRTIYNRNMVILFSLIGALIVSNIVFAVKIRQK